MREPTTSIPSSSANELPASPLTAERSLGGLSSGSLYAVTIFVSAFLLFEVQPLVAREILPWFGGSAAVWTTCMLFFQMALLAGYAYAHSLTGAGAKKASWIHRAILLISIAFLPIVPSPWWKPADGSLPLWRIIGLLCVTVGAPYFVLASTSPLLQTWYIRARPSGIPYRFFALSNFGSMLALLSYPVLVEPYFPLRVQAWIWSTAYVAFVILCLALAAGSARLPAIPPVTGNRVKPVVDRGTRTLWLLLAGSASALLLALTNHITQNIAAIPLLWILPLALYLLSFILCFESSRWYPRTLFLGLFAVAIGSMAYASAGPAMLNTVRVLVPLFCVGLFIACMVFHGELARSKPAPELLTSFYLTIALGGALGGLFVAALSPWIFPALLEFPILLTAAPAVVLFAVFRARPAPVSPAVRLSVREQFAPARFWSCFAAGVLGALLVTVFLANQEFLYLGHARLLARNFYGALRVTDDQFGIRELAHGTINHGEQYLDPVLRRKPITYYAAASGIGMLMTGLRKRGPVHFGVVGLGAGTMAAWARHGDTVRFYEINPLVLAIANSQFTYLKDTAGNLDIVLGDARLALEREPSQQFDVLAVDAFSGDSIPVHLLTREAFAIYWRHLKPRGILAIHVSNKYLNLAPPLALLARESRREAHLIETDANDATQTFASDWVLIGSSAASRFPWMLSEESEIDKIPGLRPWTDDFSNLWQILD